MKGVHVLSFFFGLCSRLMICFCFVFFVNGVSDPNYKASFLLNSGMCLGYALAHISRSPPWWVCSCPLSSSAIVAHTHNLGQAREQKEKRRGLLSPSW